MKSLPTIAGWRSHRVKFGAVLAKLEQRLAHHLEQQRIERPLVRKRHAKHL